MLVLTGANGFVGSQLVSWLMKRGGRPLLLVSRDAATLQARFPGAQTCDYAALGNIDLTGATFVHLAARNNDRRASLTKFRTVNVDHLLKTAAMARDGGATRFINLCSVHALHPGINGAYGLSKREGAEALAAFWSSGGLNLYLPAVYGAEFKGRLGVLNHLPAIVRPMALALLRQLKPVISVDRLAEELLRLVGRGVSSAANPWESQLYAADLVPAMGLYSTVKRAIDLAVVVAVAVSLGWAMLLIAIYVRLDSKGPAIFAQQRVGRHGRAFTCYKFRTMAVGTVQAGSHDLSASVITGAGGFLRRTKLDELPQVWNVLRNEMSLVGPRPCLPMQTELIAERMARGVLKMKPGITGLAQINAIDMSDPARLAAWDDRYGAFRTLLLDCLILMRTILGSGAGDRVASRAS
jgi:lipopolysaccharide/colanic/teichoic acid biosynthesis glycosyltransferase